MNLRNRRRTDIEPPPQAQTRLDLFDRGRTEDLLPRDEDFWKFEVPEPITPTVEIYSETDLAAAKKWTEGLDGDAKARAMTSLKALGSPQRNLALVDDCWRERLEDLRESMPNFGAPIDFVANQFALSGLADRVLRLPPLLLSGPGGIGKTEAAHSLAEVCGVQFNVFDMSISQTTSSLAGSEAHWSNSNVGAIFRWLGGESVHANPVIFLDELDKAADGGSFGPATNALYTLLEPRSARRFVDVSIPPMRLDASHIIWIAACNNPDLIEPALRSRFRLFEISPPSRSESLAIISSVYSRLRYESGGWGQHFPETLPSEIIEALAELPPRKIKQRLLDACGFAARHGRTHLLPSDVAGRMSQPVKRRAGFI